MTRRQHASLSSTMLAGAFHYLRPLAGRARAGRLQHAQKDAIVVEQ